MRWDPTVCSAACGRWWPREPQPSAEPLATGPRPHVSAGMAMSGRHRRQSLRRKPQGRLGRRLFSLPPSGAGSATRPTPGEAGASWHLNLRTAHAIHLEQHRPRKTRWTLRVGQLSSPVSTRRVTLAGPPTALWSAPRPTPAAVGSGSFSSPGDCPSIWRSHRAAMRWESGRALRPSAPAHSSQLGRGPSAEAR